MTALVSIDGLARAIDQVAGSCRPKPSSPARPHFRSGLCATAFASVLLAAWLPPSFAGGEWPDTPYKSWFQNLQRPDNHLNPHRDEKSRYCCGVADTVDTKFKVESTGGAHPDDVWYAWLNEAWVRIPPEKIVSDFAPNGQAYLFLLGNSIQCFVRPKGGL